MACSFFCYIKKFLSFTDPVKIFSCVSSSTLKNIWFFTLWSFICLQFIFIFYICCSNLMPQDWKKLVFIPVPKKGNAKEWSNDHTIAFISHTSKVMLKILQARLQQYVNRELPDVQARFRKGRGTRDQIANICWIREKAREFQKKSTSTLLIMPKSLTV